MEFIPPLVEVEDFFLKLVKNKSVDIKIIRKCLELLVLNPINDIKNTKDLINKVADILANKFFANGYIDSNGSWLILDYKDVKSLIIDYIYKI